MHKKSFANVIESTRGKHGYTETQMRDMAVILLWMLCWLTVMEY